MPETPGLFEEIHEILARGAPVDESLRSVLEKVLRLADAERGAIFLMNRAKSALVRRAHVGMPPEIIESYTEVPVGEQIIGTVGKTGERILVEDASSDDRVRFSNLGGLGLASFACLPIVARRNVLGVLTAGNSRPGTIDARRLSTLAAVGHQIGIALDNGDLLRRSRRSERLYRHLVDHAPDLTFLCDPSLRMIRMNRGGIEFFGLSAEHVSRENLESLIDAESVALFREARDSLVRGDRHGSVFEIKLGGGGGRKKSYEFRTSLIREEGDLFYMHYVGRNITRRKELESRLLQYADQLEGEVEKRVSELHQAKNQIAVLFQVSEKIREMESVDEKLSLIVRTVVDAKLFRKVMIRVHDGAGKRRKVASWGYGDEELVSVEREFFADKALDSPFLKKGVAMGNSYFLPADGGGADRGAMPGSARWREGDRLIVPLSRGAGRPIGFLLVEDPPGEKRPGEDLVQVLELFVNQAAQAIEEERLSRRLREADRIRREYTSRHSMENLIGSTREMRDVIDSIRKLSEVRSSVLITGESGTGKELVANAIHGSGNRRDGPFIKINCAAIPDALLESELFGIEKNVATQVDRRIGKFELADGGTLFLDEVADMSLATQAKVLRALQERVAERVGGERPIPIDVRILAATNRDPLVEVEEGRLRQDLFYRLHVVRIELPPLRDRREDIPALVDHMIERTCREQELEPKRVAPEVLSLFHRYPWPGNVRQLQNCIERALVMGKAKEEIVVDDLPPAIRMWEPDQREAPPGEGNGDLESALEAFERERIIEALEKSDWVQCRAARLLGISERAMWYRVKKLAISIPDG